MGGDGERSMRKERKMKKKKERKRKKRKDSLTSTYLMAILGQILF